MNLIYNKIKTFFSNSSLKNFGKLLTGTILGQVITAITIPISTRIYGAEYYGELAVFTSIGMVVIGFLGFGLNFAIVVADNNEDAQGLYKISVLGSFILSFILMSVVILISPFVKLFNTTMNYQLSCIIIFIYINLTNFINMSYFWLNRLGKYNVLSLNPIISPIINNVVLIAIGFTRYKRVGLIAGMLLSQVITLIHMQYNMGELSVKLSLPYIKKLLKKNLDFIIYQYPSSIANMLAGQLPVISLSYFFGNTIVGYFYMVQRLLNMPINLIGVSIGRIYIKAASDLARKGENVRIYTFNMIKRIMMIYLLPTIFIFSIGDLIVPLILGNDWIEAGVYLRIMMLWNMFSLIVYCTSGFPSIIKMQKQNMYNAIITLFADIIVLVLTSVIWKNPILTILLYSITHIVINVCFFNVMFRKDFKNKYLYNSIFLILVILIVTILIRGILLNNGVVHSLY